MENKETELKAATARLRALGWVRVRKGRVHGSDKVWDGSSLDWVAGIPGTAVAEWECVMRRPAEGSWDRKPFPGGGVVLVTSTRPELAKASVTRNGVWACVNADSRPWSDDASALAALLAMLTVKEFTVAVVSSKKRIVGIPESVTRATLITRKQRNRECLHIK